MQEEEGRKKLDSKSTESTLKANSIKPSLLPNLKKPVTDVKKRLSLIAKNRSEKYKDEEEDEGINPIKTGPEDDVTL